VYATEVRAVELGVRLLKSINRVLPEGYTYAKFKLPQTLVFACGQPPEPPGELFQELSTIVVENCAWAAMAAKRRRKRG